MAFTLKTDRLQLREFDVSDEAFILRLLNEPSFIENIADRGVRNEQQAIEYLDKGPLSSYQQHGFGLWAVELINTQTIIGMCGLVKRDNLPGVDLGYALLPEYAGQGYAIEAAKACVQAAHAQFLLPMILAIVNQKNIRSRQLLAKLDFNFQQLIALYDNEPELCLYRHDFLKALQSISS